MMRRMTRLVSPVTNSKNGYSCATGSTEQHHEHGIAILSVPVNPYVMAPKNFTTTHLRRFSLKREPKKIKIAPSKPAISTADIYGPPDPVSNIQTVRFYVPADETDIEKRYRLRRGEVLEWNHQFWAKHNTKFFKEKGDYVMNLQPPVEVGGKKSTPAEQMSVFYRQFLNENREEHLRYNREWYKKNISLLWPAFLVFWIRLRRRMFGKTKA